MDIFTNASRLVAIIIAAAIAIGGIWFGLHWYGNARYEAGASDMKAKWDADMVKQGADYAKALAQRDAENVKLAEQNGKAMLDLKRKYDDEVAKNRSYREQHADGLRLPSSVCADAGAAKGTDTESPERGIKPPAGTVLLPRAVADNLRQLMEEADNAIASCRVLQDFAVKNGLVE